MEYRRSSLNKVRQFLSQPIVYHIVGQSRSTLDFRAIMDEGKVLLVRLATGRLGEEVTALLGSVIAGQILNAALSREDVPEEKRKPFHLYADEYQRFATPDFATLLSEARKFGVATTIAHQFRGQFKPNDPNRGATLNVANKIVFRVSGTDAQEMATEFDATPPTPPVIGQKPKLSVCQNPVEHLVRNGHESETVRYLVSDLVNPLVHLASDLKGRHEVAQLAGMGLKPIAGGMDLWGYYSTLPTIQGGLRRINTWVVEMMERRTLARSAEEMVLVAGVLERLRGCLGLADDRKYLSRGVGEGWQGEPLSKASRKAIVYGLYFMMVNGDDPKKAFADWLEVRREVWLNQAKGARSKSEQEQMAGFPEMEYKNLVYWAPRLMNFGRALAESPIMVDSGQYEPIYGQPRPYADVVNEIASSLANLHPYHARCKTLQGDRVVEHNIRTLPAANTGEAEEVGRRTEKIRESTRRQYARPREEVRQQIRERQQAREEPPPVRRRT